MKILISIPDIRELKNIFYTPFFEKIRQDEDNDYIVMVDDEVFDQLFHSNNCSHITIMKYAKITVFQKIMYRVFEPIFSFLSLYPRTSPDQKIFYRRLKRFNSMKRLYMFSLYLILNLFPKGFLLGAFNLCFSSRYYKEISPDRVLLCVYHSLVEWGLVGSFPSENLYFFTDSWDSCTKQTFYIKMPNKICVWNQNMKASAIQNCGFLENQVIISGNPFWDKLKNEVNFEFTNQERNKIFFVANNSSWYYEVEIIKALKKLSVETGLFDLNVRMSPLKLPLFLDRYSEIQKVISDNHIIYPNCWITEKKEVVNSLETGEFYKDYIDQLNDADIVICLGATTIALDAFILEKNLVLVGIEGPDNSQWDPSETINREVLDDLKKNDYVSVVYTYSELYKTINMLLSKTKKRTFVSKNENIYSKRLYDAILD